MNVFLPLALLAILVVSLVLQHQRPAGRWPSSSDGIALLVLFAGAGVLLFKLTPPQQLSPIAAAAAAGVFAILAATIFEAMGLPTCGLIALGALGPAALLALTPKPLDSALMALPAAAALSSLVLPSRSSFLVTIVAALGCISAAFGLNNDLSFVSPSAGIVLFGAVALVGLGGLGFNRLAPNAAKIWPIVACVLLAAIGYGASVKYLSLGPGWVGLAAAPVVALLAYWLFETTQKEESFPLLVAAALWLGLATAAFGLSKAFGVSLALLLAVGTLAVLEADRAIVTVGPMIAVVLTQLFRQIHPNAVRSVDVGQHYILIGLAIGALLPLLPYEWLFERAELKAAKKAAGNLIWAALLCAAPLLIGIYLAPKGLVGFVAGLGLAGLFAGARKSPILVTTLSLGVACLSILEYSWMSDLTGLERPEKIRLFLYAGFALACIAAVLAALSMQPRKGLAEAA